MNRLFIPLLRKLKVIPPILGLACFIVTFGYSGYVASVRPLRPVLIGRYTIPHPIHSTVYYISQIVKNIFYISFFGMIIMMAITTILYRPRKDRGS